jgi:ankyrin repeat protein
MLINYVSILVFTLFTASWASSSDDGEETETAVGFSRIAKNSIEDVPGTPDMSSKSVYWNAFINYPFRVFSYPEETAASFSLIAENLIKEALDTPEISSKLSSSSHAILSSFSSKNEYTMPFYDFAIQNYDFNVFGFDSQDPQYWNAFINTPFREFSRNQPDQAQVIINKLVLPSHSFLSQVLFTFQTADFLDQFIPDIDIYLDKVAYTIFIQEFSQIFALQDLSEAEILFKALLRKAKNISFDDPEFKYHHAFIVNVPFLYFKRIDLFNPKHFSNICSYISRLAPILYYGIAENSKQMADKILAEILPSQTDIDITGITYEKIISEFQGSLLQPIDNSYLWDPQQFHSDLLEAVQILIKIENPNLPYYTMIIEFITKDSDLAHLFRHYIAQNYCKPSNLQLQHQPLFWRSLILSSFSVFSSLLPHYSRHIIEQLQLSPSLDQFQYLFLNETFGNIYSYKHHFSLVSEWGHTFTVDLLLQRRTDIAVADVGSVLESAAEGGHISTVDLILQRRTDITVNSVGMALESAAEGGHISTVDLILQRRTDIAAADVGSALESAAEGGHISTVDLILQRRTDIAAYHVGWALRYAAKGGHTSTVHLLLQRRTDITAYSAGRALANAAKGGHTSTVHLLLQRRTDINAYSAGRALESAAEAGHISTVQLLLQRRTAITATNVGTALRYAAKQGHTPTVDLLLQRRTHITPDDVGMALIEAADKGHTTTVDLLQRHSDITANKVGTALFCAAINGHSCTIILLQRLIDINIRYFGMKLTFLHINSDDEYSP